MRLGLCVATVGLMMLLSGCVSQGWTKTGTTATSVNLMQNNYKVIAPGAIGKSYGFRLLGIIPIVSPTYSVAQANIYQSVGEDLRGRSIALANGTEDRSSLYLILFSIPRITLTADVIEFTGKTDVLRP
ncbi:MAG: hypothetical protein FWH21_06205 [Kiritimatiellaeota bacterium]|nr:hypothetical protein [Kiritimatiellota bacterium]